MTNELMIECLEIALAQKQRKANTFKVGSAARDEILAEAGFVQAKIMELRTGGSQTTLDNTKQTRK